MSSNIASSNSWVNFYKDLDVPLSSLNNRQTLINVVRVYNVATAAFVFYGYLNTPGADPVEYFTDIGIHVLQACATENSNPLLKSTLFFLNPVRLFGIFEVTAKGITTVPHFANAIDIFNHSLNIVTTTLIIENDGKLEAKKD